MNTETQETASPEEPEAKSGKIIQSIETRTKIIERIKTSTPAVFEALIDRQVQLEVQARTTALENVFKKLDDAEKEIKKIKPDVVSYDESGKISSQSYTKETVEKKKKLQETIDKCNKAFDAAFAGDFGPAKNLQ